MILKLEFLEMTSLLAGFRPYSEINENFRKFQKFNSHFVKREEWRLQPNFEGVGVL